MRLPLLASIILASACGDVSGDEADAGAGAPDVPPPEPDQELPAAAIQRLTRAQFTNAIADLFGQAVVVPTALEPDVEEHGFFSIGASVSSLSSRGVEQYQDAAFSVAEQAVASAEVRDRIVACAGRDDACAREALTDLARRAWRRPPTGDEVEILVGIHTQAAELLGGFDAGLTYGIATILQMPSFLYRTDLGEEDPGRQGGRRYTAWEMAGRLSFFLANTLPDDELLDAAERGELLTEGGLGAQVDRLLSLAGARQAVASFFAELYTLHELDHLTKDPNIFRHASPEVGPAARQETLRTIVDLVFERDEDLGELLTSRRTFIDRRLAAIYDVPAPAREGFAATELPADGERRGLLGQVGILAQFAHPVASSATLRGKFVRQVLLCGEIPPPPADVNTALPQAKDDARTLKERVQIHLTQPQCAGCHQQMDPIGLGFERFDGLGRYRLLDNEATIDPTGELDGTPFDDAAHLAEVIREHPDFVPCFVQSLTRYAVGEQLRTEQKGELDRLTLAFEAEGRRVLPLMKAIAVSPLFRWAGEAR